MIFRVDVLQLGFISRVRVRPMGEDGRHGGAGVALEGQRAQGAVVRVGAPDLIVVGQQTHSIACVTRLVRRDKGAQPLHALACLI